MLVSRDDVSDVFQALLKESHFSCDTETTGLFPWKGDRLFAVCIATQTQAFYLNFQGYNDLDESLLLDRGCLKLFKLVFQDPTKTIFFHNAKFDMAMLYQEGLEVTANVHDTEVMARLEYNDHMKYGLKECAKRIGLEKSEAVEDYISEHHLWEWEHIPGKKTKRKNKRFWEVPFPIISEYGLQDARITYQLGMHQLEFFKRANEDKTFQHAIDRVVEIEKRATPILFKLEKHGFRVDKDYCMEAAHYEEARAKEAAVKFSDLTGKEFKDSPKQLAEVFCLLGENIPKTDKGNPSIDDEALATFKHPAAEAVRDYRDAHKRLNTYFRSFLFWADDNGRIHPNLRQSGTRTGRMSCAEPNLQNIPKNDEDSLLKYPVRRAFIPEDGHFLGMIDYDQMEFRLMLDYSGQMDLIRKIIAGYDPHQATADLTGLSRKHAKTLNFGLLYGMGKDKLSKALQIDVSTAVNFKRRYFSALDFVELFLSRSTNRARQRAGVYAWSGRRFNFPDANFSYKAANAIIQGGCADIVKQAMFNCESVLRGKRSKMVLQVHDEILFQMHNDEAHLLNDLKVAMESAYVYRNMPLTCSISHSLKSWADPVEGLPSAGREPLSHEGPGEVDPTSERRQSNLVRQDSANGYPGNSGLSDLRGGEILGARA